MAVKDGMIVDGPHWAVGYALDGGPRTGADGEVYAFKTFEEARDDYAETVRHCNEDELASLALVFHDRPASKCTDCRYYETYGVVAETWMPHWSVRMNDGARFWVDSELDMGDLIARRRATDPVKHDTYEQCDCEED